MNSSIAIEFGLEIGRKHPDNHVVSNSYTTSNHNGACIQRRFANEVHNSNARSSVDSNVPNRQRVDNPSHDTKLALCIISKGYPKQSASG